MDFRLSDEYLHRLPEAREYVDEFLSKIDPHLFDSEIKPLVFIARPYTSPYPVYNTRRAMAWYDLLADSRIISGHCPHWTMFQDQMFPQPYEI